MHNNVSKGDPRNAFPFLQGGGELGGLVRAFDWASSPLGTPDTWPQSLRTTVGILLHSRFPMVLLWGSELIQFYNDAYRPSFGAAGKHPTALGQRAQECWSAAEWEAVAPLVDGVMKTGEGIYYEDLLVPILRNGGVEQVYWTSSYSAVPDESGGFGGVLIVCSETTEKIGNLKKLAAAQRQMEITLNSLPSAIYLFERDGRISFANDPATREMKASLGDQPVPETLDELTAAVARVVVFADETGAPMHGEHSPVQHALRNGLESERVFSRRHLISGDTGWLVSRAIPLFDEAGKVARVLIINTDITAQRIAIDSILESEARFRSLAETLPQMVWVTNADGSVQEFISGKWEEYFGIDSSTDAWQNMSVPEDRDAANAAFAAAVASGEGFQSEIRLRNREGAYRWHVTIGEPVKNAEGKVLKWVGSVIDIHDRKTLAVRLEEEVAQRTAELQRSNEDLERFAHVASHDLKEPMRKIQTFASILETADGDTLSPRGKTSLQKIFNSSERMMNMISGVLAYSKLAAEDQMMHGVELKEVLKDVESDLEVAIQQKGATLISRDLPHVTAAPVLMHQLLYNLVNNALKFSRDDVPPRIVVQGEKGAAGHVKIVVSDNGIGFEPEYSEAIFKTFARLHAKDKYEGTGLGLSLCRKIVERHGGRITAEGRPGEGAAFTIELPEEA